MKVKLFLVLAVFLLIINITFASRINVSLAKTSYGSQQNIDGSLDLNITGLPVDAKLVLSINSNSIEKDIKDLCSEQTKASYSIIGSEPSPTIEFSSAGTNIDYAFDINTYLTIKPSTITLTAAQLKIQGIENPESPSLDINSDNSIEWEYIGPLIIPNQYIILPTDYLKNLQPETAIKQINGGAGEYCENVTLPLSYSYKIETYVKTINTNGNLSARLRFPNGGLVTDSNGAKANCTIERTSAKGNFEWKSCWINNENLKFVSKSQNYLICAYSTSSRSEITYYELAFQGPSAINAGYSCSGTICSYSNGLDYFIRGYYGDYEKKFSNPVNIDPDIIINSIKSCNNFVVYDGLVHCIYPLKISSKSRGKIKLSNSSISYSGTTYSNPISKILYTPELMNCTDPVLGLYFNQEDQLIDLRDLITPTDIGDYTLNIKLKYGEQTYESKSADIKVVSLPQIVLKIPKQAGVNMPITFNATVSGNSPFNYSWYFGDGSNSSEKSPVHSYTILGTYDINLTIIDKDGISNNINTTIEILSVKDTLSSLLNSTRNSLANITSKIASSELTDVTNSLKINDLITNLNFNLTKYEIDYKNTVDSTAKSEAAKEQDYSNILKNLEAL
ncbi:PKD domain-containing protein, partial [Candidatus Woesearchaeota archaeon]|nr:PKD domain-containing protein [Candidatus Woesearchaeota archaeon]